MLYFLFLLHQLLITTSVNLYQDVLCSDPMLNNWVIHFTICTFLWLVLVLLLPHIWKTKFCRFTSRMSLNDGNYTGEYFGISFLTYGNVHCTVYCLFDFLHKYFHDLFQLFNRLVDCWLKGDSTCLKYSPVDDYYLELLYFARCLCVSMVLCGGVWVESCINYH